MRLDHLLSKETRLRETLRTCRSDIGNLEVLFGFERTITLENGPIALSWLERTPDKREVTSSSLVRPTTFFPSKKKKKTMEKALKKKSTMGCSFGRAPALQAGGQEFDSPHLHQPGRQAGTLFFENCIEEETKEKISRKRKKFSGVLKETRREREPFPRGKRNKSQGKKRKLRY